MASAVDRSGQRRSAPLWRAPVVVAAVGALLVTSAAGAAAEPPEAVRDGLAPPGVYVAPDAAGPPDAAALAASVSRARDAGVELVVVVAQDPRPSAADFATRVRQLGVGDPVLVFGPDGGFGVSGEELDGTELLRAREAAEAESGPEAVTAAFTDALLEESEGSVPDIVEQVVRVVVLAVAVLVVSVATERVLRQRRRRARALPR